MIITIVVTYVLTILLCLLCYGQSKKFQTKYVVKVPDEDDRFNGTIVFGAPCSLSVDDKYFVAGYQLWNAWSMYVELVNGKGGIQLQGKNVSITLQCIEDYSDPKYVIEALNYQLASHSLPVDIFLGPYSSGLTKVVSDQIDPKNKILMAPIGSAREIYTGKNFSFSTTASSISYMHAVFRLLFNVGAKTLTIIRDKNEPLCLWEDVLTVNSSYPVKLVEYHVVDPNDADYDDQIRDILFQSKDRGVESILGCSYHDLCIKIPLWAKSIDYDPHGFLFTICYLDPTVHDILGPDVDNILGVTPWVPAVKTVDEFVGFTSLEFQSEFKKRSYVNPTYWAASGFSALEIVLAVIERRQSLNPIIIREELLSSHFKTFYGDIRFNENHQPIIEVLVTQLKRVNVTEVAADTIVDPPDKATAPIIWPRKTWNQQECDRITQSCSSHGECDTFGNCICDEQYYTITTPCDAYCDGEINEETGLCHANVNLYIWGLIGSDLPEKQNVIKSMHLAADMINNYTDGWFDGTAQVKIMLDIIEANCTVDSGKNIMQDLMNSATAARATFFAVVEGVCPAFSIGAAKLGNNFHIPQISFVSKSDDLSDKDEYHYFARTCFADSSFAQTVVEVLEVLKLVPFLAIMSTSDNIPMATKIKNIYSENGYTVLFDEHTPAPTSDVNQYWEILSRVAAAGSPVTILVMNEQEVSKVMAAASIHPAFVTNDMVWVIIEAWTGAQELFSGGEMISIRSYVHPSNVTSQYLNVLLASTNYSKFDKSLGVTTDALHAADAIFAMAIAVQKIIETGADLNAAQQYSYTALTHDVYFEGEF